MVPPPEFRQTERSRTCDQCLWRLGSTRQCIAFPKGIPTDIWNGACEHTKAYPGDGGYQFVHVEPRL